MRYLDNLIDRNFRKNKNGNTVFFPWGIFGRGRVLPDESTEARIRGWVRRNYFVFVPIAIGVAVISSIVGWAWSFLLVPVCGVWVHVGTKSLVSGLPYSDERVTLKDFYATEAERHNKFILSIYLLGAVLFVLLGIYEAATSRSLSETTLGLFVIVFSGVFGTAMGYMLKIKAA